MNRWLAGIAVVLGLLSFAPIAGASQGSIERGIGASIAAQRLSINGTQAKAAATKALRQRYGKSWRKGTNRQVDCKQFSADVWRCRTSWKRGNVRFGGYVQVITSDAGVETHIHVKRH
jgi:hypothetical protein